MGFIDNAEKIWKLFSKIFSWVKSAVSTWKQVDPKLKPVFFIFLLLSFLSSVVASFLLFYVASTNFVNGKIMNPLDISQTYDSAWITSYPARFTLAPTTTSYVPFYCLKGQKVCIYLEFNKVGASDLPLTITLDGQTLGEDFQNITKAPPKPIVSLTNKINFNSTLNHNGNYHKLEFKIERDQKDFEFPIEGRLEVECIVFVYGRLINL